MSATTDFNNELPVYSLTKENLAKMATGFETFVFSAAMKTATDALSQSSQSKTRDILFNEILAKVETIQTNKFYNVDVILPPVLMA
jgi:hypothetical protein